jgi:hypothetical protein
MHRGRLLRTSHACGVRTFRPPPPKHTTHPCMHPMPNVSYWGMLGFISTPHTLTALRPTLPPGIQARGPRGRRRQAPGGARPRAGGGRPGPGGQPGHGRGSQPRHRCGWSAACCGALPCSASICQGGGSSHGSHSPGAPRHVVATYMPSSPPPPRAPCRTRHSHPPPATPCALQPAAPQAWLPAGCPGRPWLRTALAAAPASPTRSESRAGFGLQMGPRVGPAC